MFHERHQGPWIFDAKAVGDINDIKEGQSHLWCIFHTNGTRKEVEKVEIRETNILTHVERTAWMTKETK